MTIVPVPFRSFEDTVLSNLTTTPQPGEIVHAFGEFVVVPPTEAPVVLYGVLNSNASTPAHGNINVKLG